MEPSHAGVAVPEVSRWVVVSEAREAFTALSQILALVEVVEDGEGIEGEVDLLLVGKAVGVAVGTGGGGAVFYGLLIVGEAIAVGVGGVFRPARHARSRAQPDRA